jgi:hypothetical protein
MTPQPLRLGPLARRRLVRLARQDAAAVHDTDAGHEQTTTPTVATLQARADAYARREEERFFRGMRRELTEHRMLASALRTDLDAYEDRLDRLPDPDRARVADGQGPAFEELRRLERRIRRAYRRSGELSARINTRFTAAQLRAARMFDRSDEKAAVYWGALRQATSGRVAPEPPVLRRTGWLSARGAAVDPLAPAPGGDLSVRGAHGAAGHDDRDPRRTDAQA